MAGTSMFWCYTGKYWALTEEIQGNETVVGTVAIQLPKFEQSELNLLGTVFCEFNKRIFQTPIDVITLSSGDLFSGVYSIDFENEAIRSILALKAISIERIVALPATPENAKKFTKFVSKNNFQEVEDTLVLRSEGSLQYCIIELIPDEDNWGHLGIIAR